MMKTFTTLLTTLMIVVTSFFQPSRVLADAETIFVGSAQSDVGGSCGDPDYSTYASSIDEALGAAIESISTDGDVIVICNGSYKYQGSIEWLDQTYDFSIVAEENGKVTFDGVNRYGLLAVAGDADLSIEGIRFTRANDTGAIYRPQGNLFIVSSEFVDNHKREDSGDAGFGGGAISGDAMCDYFFTIDDSIFRSNTGPTGAVSTCTVMISSSSFERNRSLGRDNGGNGGAVYTCNLAVVESSFISNYATQDGGAISACSISDLQDSRFERNTSRRSGGAIWVADPMGEPGDWTGNTFVANRARTGSSILMDCRPENERLIYSSIRRENRFQSSGSGRTVAFNHVCP
jgi:predicted outer membrane repeat protein